MKRYKLPDNCNEVREIEGVICVIKKVLVKIDEEWQIISQLIPLEQIKDE
jgi:hypothetical protein